MWAQQNKSTNNTITSIIVNTSNNSQISNISSNNSSSNNNRQRRSSTGSSSSNNIASDSDNRLLYLTPSQPSIPHFVNASFIIFCNTKQRTLSSTTTAPATGGESGSAAASVEPVASAVQTNIETKWRDPNGVLRENTKGRVHVEKRGGEFFSGLFLYEFLKVLCSI